MIVRIQRLTIFMFATILLFASVLSAYLQESYLLLVPFGFLACLFLVQNPQFLLFALIAAIPWSMEFNFKGSLGTDLPDEPLMLLTSFAALIWIIQNRSLIKPRKFHPLIWLLLLQLFWSLITVLTSADLLVSLKYLIAKCWYLAAFVAAPLIFFKNEKLFFRCMIILVISMFSVTSVVLVRHGVYHFTFASVNRALQPFFRNHVNYSSLLVCMVPVQIAIIRLSKKTSYKILFSVICCITIAALILSYARGAWLALVLGIIAYALIRVRLLFFSFLFFIALCVSVLFWLNKNDNYLKFSNNYKTTIFHPDFSEHLAATYQMKDMSTAERFYRWVAGYRMIGDSWKTGFGPTTFYDHYKEYAEPAFKTWVSRNEEHSTVHNYFLLMIIEQGALGLLLFLILMGALFWYTQKIYIKTKDINTRVITAGVASVLMMISTIIFLSDMIETDKIGSIFYISVAIVILLDIKTRNKSSDPSAHI